MTMNGMMAQTQALGNGTAISAATCYTPGIAIATPRGERFIEDLHAGDRVITRDNGIQPIRWIGTRSLSVADLTRAPHLRPVLIGHAALGRNLPEREMRVSPNYRLLVSAAQSSLYVEQAEVLTAAKHLVGIPGVAEAPLEPITYIHLLFDRHEVILSNGCWTESFHPGDRSLKGVGNAQRAELHELFPALRDQVAQRGDATPEPSRSDRIGAGA
jgi:hypothetical protein